MGSPVNWEKGAKCKQLLLSASVGHSASVNTGVQVPSPSELNDCVTVYLTGERWFKAVVGGS